jgi:hypothetical protein
VTKTCGVTSTSAEGSPAIVGEFAGRAVDYVRKAVGMELAYDSETLPLLDHYLRSVPADQPNVVALVSATSGAYFGEVVRRLLGGRWEMTSKDSSEWRVVLPTGLTFSPVGMVTAAILQEDPEEVDAEIDVPSRMRPYVELALERMADVTVEVYYSLCGRLDTMEHLQEVLVAVAAQIRQKQAAGELPESDDADEDVDAESETDEGTGPN